MDAAAEVAISNLGLSNCVEAAVLDRTGWVAHTDHETVPVTVRIISCGKSAKIDFMSTPLTDAADYVVLEYNGTPMLFSTMRVPAGAAWQYVMQATRR